MFKVILKVKFKSFLAHFEVLVLTYKALNGLSPSNLKDCISIYTAAAADLRTTEQDGILWIKSQPLWRRHRGELNAQSLSMLKC